VRFPNVVTGKTGWITIGYIPAMRYRKSATDAEKAKVRILRDELLQRCLAVVIDELITASEKGVKMTLPAHGAVWAVPRIILYACDQPEERHLLGMKLSGSYFPCSMCMEFKSHVGVPGSGACKRDVLGTLEDQMEATELAEKDERPARIEQLAKQSSITPVVPVLGAVHGLGTGTLSLFRNFGLTDCTYATGTLLLSASLVCKRRLCTSRCFRTSAYWLLSCLRCLALHVCDPPR